MSGGDPATFEVTFTNPSRHDLIALPDLVLLDNSQSVDQFKVETQDAQGAWHEALATTHHGGFPMWYPVDPGPAGKPWQNSQIFLPPGATATFRLRLAADQAVPTTTAALLVECYGSLLDSDEKPIGEVGTSATTTLMFNDPDASPTAAPTTTAATAPTTPSSNAPTTAPAAPAGVPLPTAPPTTPDPAAIAAAKAKTAVQAGPTASQSVGASLAFTGGGGGSLPTALGGAAAVLLGIGGLFLVHRRRGGHA
ncbi:hypothetical protein OG455_23865 [Kitasatospora sp. NBC_01287]|uniref:hypothetical protein n=1 Tax=Kitasatospora sp. NBC_01287 TaxID=2903573 RepID=UPI002255649C|nr:hypothetical protein [Kitasatospora sp. NBC_01287]MCX4748515.1 hypothetical protein [Kitasatospora sp. NBC_01287]